MGEVAEDMIDGTCCTYCGMYFQDPKNPRKFFTHGFPVACKHCFRAPMRKLGVQKATEKLF